MNTLNTKCQTDRKNRYAHNNGLTITPGVGSAKPLIPLYSPLTIR